MRMAPNTVVVRTLGGRPGTHDRLDEHLRVGVDRCRLELLDDLVRHSGVRPPQQEGSLGDGELRVPAELVGEGGRITTAAPFARVRLSLQLFDPPDLEVATETSTRIAHGGSV